MAVIVLQKISTVMVAVLFVYFAWIIICDVVALFSRMPKYPKAKASNIAVLICARNEENVLGNLLESLSAQHYPKDKMTVFVVAHNCTDNTAQVAYEHGATVFVRNNPDERTKGKALRYGTKMILKKYPGVYDILCVFDADNLAGKDFLKEINAAIAGGADVAQGFRNSKNYYESPVSELFGAYWYQIMICQNLPHTVMRLPATIGGTGFGVRMEALGKGWNTKTMIEDIEFSCQMTLKGRKIVLAPDAVFYDEQPTKLMVGLRQRYRWSAGGYQALKMYFPKLFKAIPRRKGSAVKMMVDLLINPVLLISLAGMIMQGVAAGLAGGPQAAVLYALKMAGLCWITVLPATLILFIKKRMKPQENIWTIIFFPYFLLLSMVFAVPALLDRNPQWKPVVHSNTATLEMMEKQ